MKFRAAILPLVLTATMLAGCGSAPVAMSGLNAKAGGFQARNAATDPLPLQAAAKKAGDLISKNPEYKNPRLVSIVGRGLNQAGELVPLLGASWTFRYWADVDTDVQLVDVILGVEGTTKVETSYERKEPGVRERVLDAEKLAPPTEVVPFAIRLGLKVAQGGPTYSYYDVIYNAFYANPSHADTDVADVVSYYRQEQLDGLHIPATAGLLPKPDPAPAPPAKKPAKKPSKMSAAALENALDVREKLPTPGRQHI